MFKDPFNPCYDGLLAYDFRGLFVFPQSLKGGMANYALVGPFCEGHFANQLWLGPDGLSQTRVFGDLSEGPFVHSDAVELFLQLDTHRVRVAGAGAAGVDQFPAFVKAKDQGTERDAFIG